MSLMGVQQGLMMTAMPDGLSLIEDLYAAGAKGAYFPEPVLASVWQNPTGVTPGEVDSRVRLRLPAAPRYSAGNIASNPGPGFTETTGWTVTVGTTVDVVDGKIRATATATTNGRRLRWSIDTEIGSVYKIIVVASGGTGVSPQFTGWTGIVGTLFPAVLVSPEFNTYEFIVVASDVTIVASFYLAIGASVIGDYIEVESLFVEKIADTAAVQVATVDSPILKVTPDSNKYWLEASATDTLIATFPQALGSSTTVGSLGADGVTWLDNQTVDTTYDLIALGAFNSAKIVVDRPLSTFEKLVIERVMLKSVPNPGEWS